MFDPEVHQDRSPEPQPGRVTGRHQEKSSTRHTPTFLATIKTAVVHSDRTPRGRERQSKEPTVPREELRRRKRDVVSEKKYGANLFALEFGTIRAKPLPQEAVWLCL